MLLTLLLLTILTGAEAPDPAQPAASIRKAERLKTPPSFALGVRLRLDPAIRLDGQSGGFLMGRGNLPIQEPPEADARVSCPIQTRVADPETDRSAIRIVDLAADGKIVRNDVASCLK